MAYDFIKAQFLTFTFGRPNQVFALPDAQLSYMDLTYCIEGEMQYAIDQKSVTLNAGDAIVFPAGSVRSRRFSESPCFYASFNIRFPDTFVPPIRGRIPNCIFPDTIGMLESFKKNYNSVSLFRQEKCAGIFSYLYSQVLEAAMDKENPHVKRTKQYVISNLSKPLTLQEIAEKVHLEPHYLCTLFKKQTGTTVMQYIINQRIDLAKRLIITQEEKLYQIAEQCGFDNYNHFSHTFKSITGLSAVQYRNLKNKTL